MKKTALITGATSGIGYALLEKYINLNYHVYFIARSSLKAQQIKAKYLDKVDYFIADMSIMKNVIDVAIQIKETLIKNNTHLDLLINNVGGIKDTLNFTEEKIEYQFALNHLSSFLLTYQLLDILYKKTIIFTGSRAHYKNIIHYNDIFYEKKYQVTKVYQQSKLANVMTGIYLHHLLKKLGISVYVVDPGLVKSDLGSKDTKFLNKLGWKIYQFIFAKSPKKAVECFAYLSETKPSKGIYFQGSQIKTYSTYIDKDQNMQSIINYSEKLLDIQYIKLVEALSDVSNQ